STTASSGGGGGRGIAIGGGLGGVLFLLVALLLGGDPGKGAAQLPGPGPSQDIAPGFDLSKCRTGADANQYVQCRVVAAGNSVDAVWKQLMRGYTRPR